MTVDQQVDYDKRIIMLTLTGQLTDEGLLSLGDLVGQIPGITNDFSLLIDLRFSSGLNVTTDGVRRMAASRLALPAASRRAIVVPSLLGYGMARMYETLRNEGAPRVFMDYDKAFRWIQTGADGG